MLTIEGQRMEGRREGENQKEVRDPMARVQERLTCTLPSVQPLLPSF
jgi:hypothetical protein